MKRYRQGWAGLLMALGATAVLPAVADEVVAYAAGGWFAVDSRAVKDTTLQGGVIIGGETNLVLQCSPSAWGAVSGGSGVTVAYNNTTSGGSGTIVSKTAAPTVDWTPPAVKGTYELTHQPVDSSGSALGTALSAVFEVKQESPSVPILAQPTAVNSTTLAVYTNGFLSAETASGSGLWNAWSNQIAVVVYTAEDGYFFEGGATVITNTFDTSKNPATAPVPAAPSQVKYTAPVYVDNVASNGVAYWTTNTLSAFTVVKSSASAVTWGEEGATNWYAVMGGDIQIGGGVVCQGHVNLILCKGAKLLVKNAAYHCAGIATDANGSFMVYGQPDGAGALEVNGGEGGAGIGGIYMGGGSGITINGGTVTTTGGENGAGIGGGIVGVGSDITINGGTVMAIGGSNGAGIGGGSEGGGLDITINGGTVTATGGEDGSGIGGGCYAAGSYITINGGTVTTMGGENGAGIGGGERSNGLNITINGGTITATGGDYAAGVGGGLFGMASDIVVNGGEVRATGGERAAGIGGSEAANGPGDARNITINGGTVTATGGYNSAGIGGGSGGSCSGVTINGGKVMAIGGPGGAGIGGGSYGGGSNLAINGGTVTAIGNDGAAGIGGGDGATGSNITITKATVFVCGVIDYRWGRYYYPDLIGSGEYAWDEASGVVIDPSAKVLFNLTGVWDFENEVWLEEMAPMPADFDGFVVLTPETQTDERVLVGGCAEWTAAKTFSLTNAVTGATGSFAVNGDMTEFANFNLNLRHANNALMLRLGIPVGDDAFAWIDPDGWCGVYGTGDIWSYDVATNSALWAYRDSITSVYVAYGITGVGANSFAYMRGVKDVDIGETVTNIAEKAFYHCTYITNLVVDATNIETVGPNAFERCYALEHAYFGSSQVFDACRNAFKVTARITMDGDKPIIEAVPDVEIEEYEKELQGKTNLTDSVWIPIKDPESIPYGFHFFRWKYGEPTPE